jgi:hypothetical protein
MSMMGVISRALCVMSMVGRGFGGCSVYMCHFFLLN